MSSIMLVTFILVLLFEEPQTSKNARSRLPLRNLLAQITPADIPAQELIYNSFIYSGHSLS